MTAGPTKQHEEEKHPGKGRRIRWEEGSNPKAKNIRTQGSTASRSGGNILRLAIYVLGVCYTAVSWYSLLDQKLSSTIFFRWYPYASHAPPGSDRYVRYVNALLVQCKKRGPLLLLKHNTSRSIVYNCCNEARKRSGPFSPWFSKEKKASWRVVRA